MEVVELKQTKDRKGMSPVMSSIILCSVVLVIGASVWSVASSASTIIQLDYYDEVMESVEKIKERFVIENIALNNVSQPTLKIWLFNYGTINATIDLIQIKGYGNTSSHLMDVLLPIGDVVQIELLPIDVPLSSGLSISIEVKSTRGNKAYASILIP